MQNFPFDRLLGPALLLLFLLGKRANGNCQTISWADSCSNNSFIGSFFQPDSSYSDFRNVHECSNGDLVLTGLMRPPAPFGSAYKLYALVMRVSNTGQLIWIKFLGHNDPQGPNSCSIFGSLVTANGDIVVCANSWNNTSEGSDVIRMDGNGNVIWKKHIPKFLHDYFFDNIIQTSDGGFLLSGGWETHYIILLKLNNAGDALWEKMYIANNSYWLYGKSITESPSGYYLIGESQAPPPTLAGYNLLLKINKNNGDTIWTKKLVSASSNGNGAAEYGFDWIDFRNNTLYLQGASGHFNNPHASIFVEMDDSANILNSRRIEIAGTQMYEATWFRHRTFDRNSFTGMYYPDQNNANFFVYRLDSQYHPRWAWQLPYTGTEFGRDMQVFSDSSVAICGYTTTNAPNAIKGIVMKTTKLGTLINCSPLPAQVQVSSPAFKTLPTSLYHYSLMLYPAPQSTLPVVNGYAYQWNIDCLSTGACRLSKIQGPGTACNNTSVLYKVSRGGTCANPVQFSADPGVQVQSISDTSAIITFTGTGAKKIIASMPVSCGNLVDSLVVSVHSNPSPGISKFSTVCTNAPRILSLSDTYASYLWQDNSTLPTYAATDTGWYAVVVTSADGCRGKDSIHLKQLVPSPATFCRQTLPFVFTRRWI